MANRIINKFLITIIKFLHYLDNEEEIKIMIKHIFSTTKQAVNKMTMYYIAVIIIKLYYMNNEKNKLFIIQIFPLIIKQLIYDCKI